MNKPVAWDSLKLELDRWAERDMSATFWWRDDDACAATPQLKMLDDLSQRLGVPVSIAVIPDQLETSLAHYILDRENFTVLQHGFAHTSYAAPGVKKIEIGGQRDTPSIVEELVSGMNTLQNSFTDHFRKVLVPPWNRIEARVLTALSDAGFSGVSSMWARKHDVPLGSLHQVNTHLDPVNWRFGGGFSGEYRAIGQLRRHLYARRTGLRDLDEHTGLMTHHLVQNEDVWQFCRRLMAFLNGHPAVS